MFKRSLFLFALLASAASAPAWADDQSIRMDQMQDQIRQLTGQIEQLNYQIKQLQTQRKQAAVEAPAAPVTDVAAAPQIVKKPKLAAPTQEANAAQGNANQGIETIGGISPVSTQQVAAEQTGLAPAPAPLGMTKAAKTVDGGFQGKLIVAPGGSAIADGAPPAVAQQVAIAQPASAPAAETPDDLFQRNYQAFMQLRYPEAEAGFKEFITKYPDHGMAGSAGFWMGEAFWAEQNFGAAAQAYQDSYKRNPKGRRAPDSLLKLGLSLSRLGQKEQACTVIASVDTEYPSAVDVKKRAQQAYKREGCS